MAVTDVLIIGLAETGIQVNHAAASLTVLNNGMTKMEMDMGIISLQMLGGKMLLTRTQASGMTPTWMVLVTTPQVLLLMLAL